MDFAAAGNKRRIFGVDFSGAKDAGRKIWITEAAVQDGVLTLSACYPVCELVPDKNKGREVGLEALCRLILSNPCSVFGMDFPFSLPEKLLSAKEWTAFISDFLSEYRSVDDFRKRMRETGGKKELKRLTDIEVKAPFSIYNLRIYRQTYFGIRDVLRPLVISEKVCAVPMQKPDKDRPWLMEICPASTLKKEGLYIGYKGNTPQDEEKRSYITERFIEKGISVPEDIRLRIVKNKDGDALDSFIAAYAAYSSVLKLGSIIRDLPGIYLREGYTFF